MRAAIAGVGMLLVAGVITGGVVMQDDTLAVAQTAPPAQVCDNAAVLDGPSAPSEGAVVVPAGDNSNLVPNWANPGFGNDGVTWYFESGVHTLGNDDPATPENEAQYAQIAPGNNSTFIGAPGAIIDGQSLSNYAFTSHGLNVTIKHLTVRGFTPPLDQGVVNHDSGNGWLIEANTIELNGGAALMAGDDNVIRGNCVRDNGQYGLNAYQGDADGPTNLLLQGNEFSGNNTLDVEKDNPGCGCSGAMKLWSVDGADILDNWIHDNNGAGIWADNNNNDFLIQGNLIENNAAQGIFYEQSYNALITGNTLRGNTIKLGRSFAARGDGFPIGTIYVSEAGGDPRIPARYTTVEITANEFDNNWGGIALWENADRFCNSPANTGSDCTLPMGGTQERVSECSQPGISSEPLYWDCRWRTKDLDIHHNTFSHDPLVIGGIVNNGCDPKFCGISAVFSNVGTYPDWSPYHGDVIQQAITWEQNNRWHDNTYTGPWSFKSFDMGPREAPSEWQATGQDTGSTFDSEPTSEPTEEPTSEPTSGPTSEPTTEPTTAPTTDPEPAPLSVVVLELGDGTQLLCPFAAPQAGQSVTCTYR